MAKEGRFHTIWTGTRQWLELELEYAKLTAAEKVTILLTTVAVALITGVLGVLMFFFISIAVVHWLAMAGMTVALAYSIMSGVYLLLMVVLWILRKPLILNPVARFISRLFLK